ncbi:hypothetical protein [Methanoregula sp.]|uniref:hypothetical protein n=1 Tax=Methanoregula sp. TaxID=2052170 RepID=UPI000CCA1290|nr:hypothetical protein [Methanoregula sp.]PKG33114.1 MAG: hypothetical protein CW742_04615 [Methanoregula sp.]
MAKQLNLPTRAFGAEPQVPDRAVLADWIAEHRGRLADIITYRLDQSLAPQIPAGIGTSCAGGRFYGDRIRQSIEGITGNRATGELHANTPDIIEDAAAIVVQKKGSWCAMPAPHALGIQDAYYCDADEWNDAICGIYRTLMRAMRDTGVFGHVLIGEQAGDPELIALAGQNAFFFAPEPDREILTGILEHQQQVALTHDRLETLFDLMNEYAVRRIFLLDPDDNAIRLARTHFDPDQIIGAGYCMEECDAYWKGVVERSVYVR